MLRHCVRVSDMVLAVRLGFRSWSAVARPVGFPRRFGRLLNCCAVSSSSSPFLFFSLRERGGKGREREGRWGDGEEERKEEWYY